MLCLLSAWGPNYITGMVTLAGEAAWIAGEVAALFSNIHLMPPSWSKETDLKPSFNLVERKKLKVKIGSSGKRLVFDNTKCHVISVVPINRSMVAHQVQTLWAISNGRCRSAKRSLCFRFVIKTWKILRNFIYCSTSLGIAHTLFRREQSNRRDNRRQKIRGIRLCRTIPF